MRLLYASDSPHAVTGYGVQTSSLVSRLAKLPNIEVASFAWAGQPSGIQEFEGIRVYPSSNDKSGSDVLPFHAKHFRADVVISLQDAWMSPGMGMKLPGIKYLPWFPVDTYPVSEILLASLEGSHIPLTYSRWGSKVLAEAGVPNKYLAHGVEPSVYRVLEDRERVLRLKREMFGSDDLFLCVMVAANGHFPDRKAFQVQFRAFAKFAQNVPEARLYVHSDPGGGGIDLRRLAHAVGCPEKILFPNPYEYWLGMRPDQLAMIYNMADAYLGASMSEGFGIPLIESQACGTPVIVTDFSSMPELVRWGHKVQPLDVFWSNLGSWWAWPDVGGIEVCLGHLHEEWKSSKGAGWPPSLMLAVSQRIHKEFGWDKLVESQWVPLLNSL